LGGVKMKKKGSLMVEVLIALGVLSVMSILAINTCGILIISNDKRINKHKMNECVYGVVNDIKYNIKYNELIIAIKSNNISKKYGNEFLYNLATKNLLLCEAKVKEDEKIDIELLNRETYIQDKTLSLKIQINYRGEYLEKTITKDPWMDYV
jgi:hypothetical protein